MSRRSWPFALAAVGIGCTELLNVGDIPVPLEAASPDVAADVPQSDGAIDAMESGTPAAILAIAMSDGGLTITQPVVLTDTSGPLDVTVENVGTASSGAVAIALSGANASEASVVHDGCTGMTLSAGGTCGVQVALTPTSLGSKSLVLGANASPGGTATIDIDGTAVAGWVAESSISKARQGVAVAPVTKGGVAGVLAIGGSASGSNLPTTEFYDPDANTWTSVQALPEALSFQAASPVTIGGVTGVLAMGGTNGVSQSNGPFVTNVTFYDPTMDMWTTKASMLTARDGLAASPVTIGGVAGVLAVGGSGLATVEFYDPTMDKWTAETSLPAARTDPAAVAVTIGGVAGVLVLGGDNGGPQANAWFFNPMTHTWSTEHTLSTARSTLAASVITLAVGDAGATTGVLAVGGYDGSNYVATTEFYDPATNAWTPLPYSMITARGLLGAAPVTRSGIASVLAVGGWTGSTETAAAEFFAH